MLPPLLVPLAGLAGVVLIATGVLGELGLDLVDLLRALAAGDFGFELATA